jgi:hypothetical protein
MARISFIAKRQEIQLFLSSACACGPLYLLTKGIHNRISGIFVEVILGFSNLMLKLNRMHHFKSVPGQRERTP